MRRVPMLAASWITSVAVAAPALAQFASDRAPMPVPSAAPAYNTPAPQAAPATPRSTTAGYAPAQPVTQPVPAEAPHPWGVKPEHGAYFICAKSYVGENSRAMAEELATEIRQTYKAAAYLYEWGADQRRKEEERRNLIREKLREQQAPFLALREEMKKKAETEGVEFDDTPVTVRVPKVTYQQQWAVLIGGFKDMDTAAAALKTVRTWGVPESKSHLLDRAVISGGQQKQQGAYLNPFASAFVVPNPTLRKAVSDEPPVDPLLAKLNENEELSLLKCKKPVTLLVKSFSVPSRTVTPDSDTSVIGKLFGGQKPGSMLDATAQQARTLAESLRSPQMTESLSRAFGLNAPLESYVLHVRTGSLVCVGQFDSADDPELERIQRILSLMTFKIGPDPNRPTGVERMFDQVYPIPIPRAK